MKLKTIALLITLTFFSCKQNQTNKFIINGVLKGDSPEFIYLHIGSKLDSCMVLNHKFSFMGNVDSPVMGFLSIPPISTIQDPFYIDNSTITMSIDVEKRVFNEKHVNFIKVTTLTGTKTKPIQDDFDKFFDAHKGDHDWNAKLYKKLEEIIEHNPQNGYSGDLLSEISKDSILTLNQLEILSKKVDWEYQSKSSFMVIKNILDPYAKMEVGNHMIDFKLPDQQGNYLDTKTFKDNILLVDFWASWCVPCRKQNKELSVIYAKYNAQGFNVLGVSVDTDSEKWKKAINKDNLAWTNVIDIDGFDGEVPAMYNVTYSIPHNFLMDENGKIIAEDISMDDLDNVLKEVYK